MRASMLAPAARRRPGRGLPCLVMSGVLWGTGGLTGVLLSRVTGLSALSVAAYRLTGGGVLIVAFLTLTGRRWPASRAAWARIAVIGALAALYQGCYFTAVALTSVALAILAAAGFAAVTLAGARPVTGLDDLTMTGFGFTAGGLVLMPLAAAVGSSLAFRPGPEAIGLLIALGTGPTAVAYSLYFRGLRTEATSTGALLALLEPLTGTILAALVLGQHLSASGIIGAAVLALAVIITIFDADHGAGLIPRPG
jgi:drug/metabolite transporter, DME family